MRTCTEQTFGGKPCDQLDGVGLEVSACRTSSGPCPEDCEVSVWSKWGDCNHNCGAGTKKRTRNVVVMAGKTANTLNKPNLVLLRYVFAR